MLRTLKETTSPITIKKKKKKKEKEKTYLIPVRIFFNNILDGVL
jgi:hypothetical protein